jgi:hypothetical protein
MSTTESFAPPTPQQVPVDNPSSLAPVPAESSTPKEEKPEPAKKPDLDTAIKTAFEKSQAQKDAKDAAAKPQAKEEATPAKPEPASAAKPQETAEAKAVRERDEASGKFVSKEPKEPSASTAEPADGSGQDGKAQARPSEGRDYTKPPAHFLPRAKEGWGSTPPDVQGEVHRMVENYEKGLSEYKESHEKWKPLREFEQIAKQAGTTVPDYLKSVYAIDQLIRTNPVEGIKRVLATANITPEQYARHVLSQSQQQAQNPQAQAYAQLQQRIQQQDQKLAEMEAQNRQREEESRLQQVAQKFIEPFKTDHPRYDELEGDIAFFLNSGKISSSLSEHERLEAAYDMAERINPAPKFAANEPGTQAFAPRPLDPAGQKSVTGSPTPGLSTTRPPSKDDAKDLDAILRRSLAKATAR